MFCGVRDNNQVEALASLWVPGVKGSLMQAAIGSAAVCECR